MTLKRYESEGGRRRKAERQATIPSHKIPYRGGAHLFKYIKSDDVVAVDSIRVSRPRGSTELAAICVLHDLHGWLPPPGVSQSTPRGVSPLPVLFRGDSSSASRSGVRILRRTRYKRATGHLRRQDIYIIYRRSDKENFDTFCAREHFYGTMAGFRRIDALVILIAMVRDGWPGGIGAEGQMSVNFYQKTCPNVESIIRGVMVQKLKESPFITGPATLRLFFHDCFVDGCDGSVLISSTPGNKAERDAPPNLSLAGDGFDVVIRAKTAVERSCPGVVSCADILAVLARDATALSNGPSWQVLKGRRDGRASSAARATSDMPGADFNADRLIASFASKGLSSRDMVTLSGGHTIGHSHCSEITKRLYHFSPSNPTDPSMDGTFAGALKQGCPASGGNPSAVQPFDRLTPFSFDNLYYKDLAQRQGLLTSDQVLFTDVRTRGAVLQFARNQGLFFSEFAAAMQRLGSVGVKTGNDMGEIRRDCTKFNS